MEVRNEKSEGDVRIVQEGDKLFDEKFLKFRELQEQAL